MADNIVAARHLEVGTNLRLIYPADHRAHAHAHTHASSPRQEDDHEDEHEHHNVVVSSATDMALDDRAYYTSKVNNLKVGSPPCVFATPLSLLLPTASIV